MSIQVCTVHILTFTLQCSLTQNATPLIYYYVLGLHSLSELDSELELTLKVIVLRLVCSLN